jgi:UDP-N-acetyl-2-amino-2-deoxyglucuronate dehydrogenase
MGLVGCGSNGQIHADGLAKLAQDGVIDPVAAADPDPGGRAAAGRNCRFGGLVADPEEVLADPSIEAVMVCTPTRIHAELVGAAVAAGKAVMCEKPLCPDYASVEALCAAVAASGVVAQVGFQSRFHPLYRHLVDQVRERTWGGPMAYTLRDDQFFPTTDFVSGHSSWRQDPELAGGGALLEHSIHAVDVLLWTFGPVRQVFAHTRNAFGYGVEDTAALTIEHESGVVGNLISVFNGVVGREERRLEVFFEQATLELTSDFIVGAPEDSLLVQLPGRPADRPDLAAMREETFTRMGLGRRDFLFYQYAADRTWALAVRGRPAPAAGFTDALAAHAVVEAAYRSAATGRPVELSEVVGADR